MLPRVICWTRISRVFTTKFFRINTIAALAGFIVFCFTLWLTGLSDFLFETRFKYFKWPPYVDVRGLVVRELTGRSLDTPYLYEWKNFTPLATPSCRNNRFTRRRFILIIVKSAPHRILNRNAIRETYGAIKEFNNFRFRTVFAMGMPEDSTEQKILKGEALDYEDMLIGNFTDHYFNNTYKFMNSIDLAQSFCGHKKVVPYLLLVDDDYCISFTNLVAEFMRHTPNERLYMGWRFISSPFRFFTHKHRVSLKDYPFNAYPPYITGGAVLLTEQTIKEFYLAIQHTEVFAFDDVYAGILAYLLGINVQHNENITYMYSFPQTIEEAKLLWQTRIAAHGFTPKHLRRIYKDLKDVLIPNAIT